MDESPQQLDWHAIKMVDDITLGGIRQMRYAMGKTIRVEFLA
jgi:hypothetical protein